MKDLKDMSKAELMILIQKNRLFVQEEKPKIKGPSECIPLLVKYGNKEQEHFVVVTLSGAHTVISVTAVTVGIVNRTLIHPREVFRKALKDNAAAIIIAHNHPSGVLDPSNEDIEVCKRMVSAGEVMGIPVLDNIIVGPNGVYNSFQETGEWDKL